MSKLIDLLLDAGVTPDHIPAECNRICKDKGTENIMAFNADYLSGTGHFIASYKGVNIPKEVVNVSDFISAYNLRNNPPEDLPEHHQTIEQLIAQMDTQADMAKRHTMEQIRLRDLIAARLNPLGYYLTKK